MTSSVPIRPLNMSAAIKGKHSKIFSDYGNNKVHHSHDAWYYWGCWQVSASLRVAGREAAREGEKAAKPCPEPLRRPGRTAAAPAQAKSPVSCRSTHSGGSCCFVSLLLLLRWNSFILKSIYLSIKSQRSFNLQL